MSTQTCVYFRLERPESYAMIFTEVLIQSAFQFILRLQGRGDHGKIEKIT